MIDGGSGNDILQGTQPVGLVSGGPGADQIRARHAERLTCGAGIDRLLDSVVRTGTLTV
jgi:Ca2+-binding RTX toxin-like protein